MQILLIEKKKRPVIKLITGRFCVVPPEFCLLLPINTYAYGAKARYGSAITGVPGYRLQRLTTTILRDHFRSLVSPIYTNHRLSLETATFTYLVNVF